MAKKKLVKKSPMRGKIIKRKSLRRGERVDSRHRDIRISKGLETDPEELRKSKVRQKSRDYVEGMSPERYEEYREDYRRRARERYHSMSPEEVAKDRKKTRDYYKNMTPEQKKIMISRTMERAKERFAKETPEQRAARMAKINERTKKRIAAETPEQGKFRRARNAERMRRLRKKWKLTKKVGKAGLKMLGPIGLLASLPDLLPESVGAGSDRVPESALGPRRGQPGYKRKLRRKK